MSKALYQYYTNPDYRRQHYETYKNYDYSAQVVPKYEKEKIYEKQKKNI